MHKILYQQIKLCNKILCQQIKKCNKTLWEFNQMLTTKLINKI